MFKQIARSFVLFMGLSLAFGAQAANEVKLDKACSRTHTRYGSHWQSIEIQSTLKSFTGVKNAFIHLKTETGEWKDFPLVFKRATGTGSEVWSLNQEFNNAYFNPEFVLKYEANGQTYWDNNGGKNYKLEASVGCELYGTNVLNNNYSAVVYANDAGASALYLNVHTKNLGAYKVVSAIYSVDNWKTVRTVDLNRNAYEEVGYSLQSSPNANGVEGWGTVIALGVLPLGTDVQYAIRYVVNGKEYWDNNYTKNYQATVIKN